ESEAWFASTQRTIFQMAKLHKSGAPMVGPMGPLPTNALEMFNKTVAADIDGELDDKASCIASFERHNAEVQRTVPARKLLIYDVQEGWEPLCAFRGVPVPNQPFPKENTSAKFAAGRNQSPQAR